MAKIRLNLYEKLFRKAKLLKPLPDGSFQAIDITGNIEEVLKTEEGITELQPQHIYPVHGLKGVGYICIQDYSSIQLQDLFGEGQSPLDERAIANMLEDAEAAGRLEGSEGGYNDKLKKQMLVIMVASIMAAALSLMVYVKTTTGG